MSTTTTPTRHGRGMPVPGIDTSSHEPKPISNQGWPLTPPQSAVSNESRRPSLAYSSLSEASHSGPSSICGYSQPATPVSAMHSTHELRPQWADTHDVLTVHNGMNDTCSQGQIAQPMFSAAYPQQQTPAYSTADAFRIQAATQSSWSNSQQIPSQYQNHQAGLSTTLFQTTQSLGHETLPAGSMCANPSSSIASLQASPFSNPYATTASQSGSIYQPTQVVVPSQVTPHDDYPMADFPGYNGQEDVSDGFAQRFDSSTSGYSNWEMVGPQSPGDAYFGHSDEEDYVNVKDEAPMTPTRGHNFSYLSPHQARPRRRSSRRGRKANPEGKAWYENESHGIRMRCEGKRFAVIPNTGSSDQDQPFSLTVVPEETRDSKPHKCHHKDDNGNICGRRFERSEHLKRHQGMHTKVRAYACPLPFCDKKIGRPDNAGDHFKTHLKGYSKVRRNKPCTFPELEQGILQSYEKKTATKFLSNLRKWMVTENERKALEEQKKEREEREKAYRCML